LHKVLSEIEWQRRDREWITRHGDKAKRKGKPVFLERQWRQGWSAALPLYLLWCQDCEVFTVTHPAGYGRIGCKNCRASQRVMTWNRFRDKRLKPFLYIFPRVGILALIVTIIVLLASR
jgi:hypothetical protein